MTTLLKGSLIVLALAAASVAAQQADAAETLSPIRSVSVNGLAERKIVPDEAHILVNLNSMDKKIAEAKAAHDKKLSKLMDIVKGEGIEEKKVRTQYSNVQPVYHYDNDAKGKSVRTFDGYRVQTNLDITVADTKKLGTLMDKISSAGFEDGANTEWGDLMSMSYSISNPNKVRDEMLAEATANAKQKATNLATATGATLGRVYQINEGAAPSFMPVAVAMPRMMAMKASAPGMAAAPPPAGEQELQASVNIVYELKD